MIRDRATARRAGVALKGMRRLIDTCQADAATRERYRAGCEMLVAFELTETRTISEHLALEVAAAHWRGRQAGEPLPLDPGQPVPGCTCPECTGLAADHPARRRRRSKSTGQPLDLDAALAVPMTDVADRLGIEHRRGWARCPFHEDRHPSFHLNDQKQAAFCNVCGKRWDGVALTMELRNLSFPDAVKELTR